MFDRDCKDSPSRGLLENFDVFLGLEGSKQPQDYGVNAHLGGRFSVNKGLPLWESAGLGLQVGTSLNYTENAVQVFERFGASTHRTQSFTTVGLFQRLDSGLVWAGAWDFLYESYFDHFSLNQFRGQLGWRSDADELGLRASLSGDRDRGTIIGVPVTLKPLSQGNAYWRHTWESQAETTLWVGLAESHGQRNLAFEALLGDPRQAASGARLLFGAEIQVPLNDHWALFGQGNFITPADTGSVDAYLGVCWYPAGGAYGARQRQFAPVLPVANSPTFTVDLR